MNDQSNEPTKPKVRRSRLRYAIYAFAIIAIVLGMIDYRRYYSQLDQAMAVVSDLEGHAGSLLDWPFGREIVVSFERPLDREEVNQLTFLNSLKGRHVVTVVFRCQLTPKQLSDVKEALSDCAVRQVDN